jgi:hypothetical protein
MKLILFMVMTLHVAALQFSVQKAKKQTLNAIHRASKGIAWRHRANLIEQGLFTDQDNVYLLTNLSMGPDKQKVTVAIDTGSPWIYIMDYDCGDSGALKLECDRANIPGTYSYLDGSVVGRKGSINLWVNDDSIESVGHDFLVADQYTDIMKTGLVGLSKGYGGEKTFLNTLLSNGIINQMSFSISSFGDKLELILGGIDRSKVQAGAKEVTIGLLSDSSYHVRVQSISIGSRKLSQGITALLDSGNTLIALPDSMSSDVIDYLQSQDISCYLEREENPSFKFLVCALAPEQNFPDLVFEIGGQTFTSYGDDLISGCVKEDYDFFYSTDDYRLTCEMNIEFHIGARGATIGKAFIEKNYLTFNLDQKEVTIVQNVREVTDSRR